MQIETEFAYSGMMIPMRSPEYDATVPHCLSLEYLLEAADDSTPPALAVYMRSNNYMFSGRKLWYISDRGWGQVYVDVPTVNNSETFQLDFMGTIGEATSTIVALTNVQFVEGHCDRPEMASCLTGYFHCASGECVPETNICDGLPDCIDETDEWNICSKCQFKTCFVFSHFRFVRGLSYVG